MYKFCKFIIVALCITLLLCVYSLVETSKQLKTYHQATEKLINQIYQDWDSFGDVTMESDVWEEYYEIERTL